MLGSLLLGCLGYCNVGRDLVCVSDIDFVSSTGQPFPEPVAMFVIFPPIHPLGDVAGVPWVQWGRLHGLHHHR